MMEAALGDRTPLLAEEGGLRQRSAQTASGDRYKPDDWDPTIPYGGKVYLARKRKQDPLWVRLVEAFALLGTIAFALYAYFYFDNLHFHVTHGYAKLGYASAQHQVGQRYLHGVGTDKDHYKAMEYFKLSADQGHAHASYNLAVGHMKGYTKLEKGEPKRLIHHAASKGVKEAHRVLNDVCSRGGCE